MCDRETLSLSALELGVLYESSMSSPEQTFLDTRDTHKVYIPHMPSSSRSASTASVPNFSRVLPGRSQSKTIHMPHHNRNINPATIANSCLSKIKRWDSESRTYSGWDGLRHDGELWSTNGDCLVHLYGKGKSRRSPSFKVSFTRLKAVGSGPLFSMCFAQTTPEGSGTPRTSDCDSSSSLSDSGYSSVSSADTTFELYVPAPEQASREDAFRWHLATRNFFAWASDKPLVGATLGKTLIELLQRMCLFRLEGADNVQALLAYAERLGYLDFRDCPDYALAFLNFAEHYHLRDLWIDAFAHCVGMNERLCLSPEFDSTSRVTKALITRAYLEMDLHLGRVSRALRNFLEEELSPSNFGLSVGAQAHLDRFRSFLHSFYVNKFGYWPPERSAMFDKSVLRSLYAEFHNLYEFIVDVDSSDVLHAKPASGGICVLQNINSFNERHNYDPLPHPLPLLPDYQGPHRKIQTQRGLRAFRLGSKSAAFEKGMTIKTALAMATNPISTELLKCPLVRDYVLFEREWSPNPEEKISVVDARKVRWIAIYCILQMLVSVTRAPKEVRTADGTSYPLCLLTTGTPPWGHSKDYATSAGPSGSSEDSELRKNGRNLDDDALQADCSPSSPAPSIHPDCEDDDYFSIHKVSDSTSPLRPAPLRINPAPIARTSSIRSLQRSVMSMSFSSRRNSIKGSPISRQSPGFCAENMASELSAAKDETVSVLPEARTPVLDVLMLEHLAEPTSFGDITAPSPSSASSPKSISSSLSDGDDTDAFSWSSNDERRSSKVYNMDHDSIYDDTSSAKPYSHSPTSSTAPSSPTSRFSHKRSGSLSSSVYSEHPVQASDIAEYQRRGQQNLADDLREAQQLNLPMWWSSESSPRPVSKKHDSWPLNISVPQEVPEDGEMVFEGQEQHVRHAKADEDLPEVNFNIDILEALELLPRSTVESP